MKFLVKTTQLLLVLFLFQSCLVEKDFFKPFNFKQKQFVLIDSVLVERADCKHCEKEYFLNVKETEDAVINIVNNHVEGVQFFEISNKCQYSVIVGKLHNDKEVIHNIVRIINTKRGPL